MGIYSDLRLSVTKRDDLGFYGIPGVSPLVRTFDTWRGRCSGEHIPITQVRTLGCKRLCDSLQVAHSQEQQLSLQTPIPSTNIYMSDYNAQKQF